jgi:hypothetical protein
MSPMSLTDWMAAIAPPTLTSLSCDFILHLSSAQQGRSLNPSCEWQTSTSKSCLTAGLQMPWIYYHTDQKGHLPFVIRTWRPLCMAKNNESDNTRHFIVRHWQLALPWTKSNLHCSTLDCVLCPMKTRDKKLFSTLFATFCSCNKVRQ